MIEHRDNFVNKFYIILFSVLLLSVVIGGLVRNNYNVETPDDTYVCPGIRC